MTTYLGDGLSELHLAMSDGIQLSSCGTSFAEDGPDSDCHSLQVCALAAKAWEELRQVGARSFGGHSALSCITIRGSKATAIASPVGDGARFVVVGILDKTASTKAAKAALLALCSALEVPLRAVTAALGGDLDEARRTIAEATAAATAPAGSAEASTHASGSSADATGASTDIRPKGRAAHSAAEARQPEMGDDAVAADDGDEYDSTEEP